DGEVAARALERHLERPVVLGPDADLLRIGDLLLVEGLAVLEVVEERGVGGGAGRVQLALPRPLEVARRDRRIVRPPRGLADGERPHRAVLVAVDLGGHPRHRDEVGVEHHEPGEQGGHTRAIEVLVEVVARRVILVEAAAAEAEDLLLGELLAGSGLARRRGLGPRRAAEPAQSGPGPPYPAAIAPAAPARAAW